MKKIVYIILLLLSVSSCTHNVDNDKHLGSVRIGDSKIQLDSIRVPADTTSLRGDFQLMDSSLMFVDMLYCKIYSFSLRDGSLQGVFGGYGQGPNEMIGVLNGAVVHPADTSMYILNSSNQIYEFTPSDKKVNFKGRINFKWGEVQGLDYESVSVYNIMQMSDFSISFYSLNDSIILFPVNLLYPNTGHPIKQDRYDKAHVLGELDSRSLEVAGLLCNMPEYYKEKPLPYFEFLDFAVDYDNAKIYVNHAPDSLIYCYNYDGEVLNTLGFEPHGVDRSYTFGITTTNEDFKNDIKHTGANTGLYYDEKSKLLFRTSMTDTPTGKIIMQVYRDNDLILEEEMPAYFKLLGRYGDKFYGTRFLPYDDGEKGEFVIYSFEIDE